MRSSLLPLLLLLGCATPVAGFTPLDEPDGEPPDVVQIDGENSLLEFNGQEECEGDCYEAVLADDASKARTYTYWISNPTSACSRDLTLTAYGSGITAMSASSAGMGSWSTGTFPSTSSVRWWFEPGGGYYGVVTVRVTANSMSRLYYWFNDC